MIVTLAVQVSEPLRLAVLVHFYQQVVMARNGFRGDVQGVAVKKGVLDVTRKENIPLPADVTVEEISI